MYTLLHGSQTIKLLIMQSCIKPAWFVESIYYNNPTFSVLCRSSWACCSWKIYGKYTMHRFTFRYASLFFLLIKFAEY